MTLLDEVFDGRAECQSCKNVILVFLSAVRVKKNVLSCFRLSFGFFEILCLNSWAAAAQQRRRREMNHCRGSSEFPWKLYPVKFNSNKLHSRKALIKIIGLLRWRGADAHFLLRCCRALSQSEEWDSHKVHLASDECNYVSASDACRSVCSAWCDALCLRLFTVKLNISGWWREQNTSSLFGRTEETPMCLLMLIF